MACRGLGSNPQKTHLVTTLRTAAGQILTLSGLAAYMAAYVGHFSCDLLGFMQLQSYAELACVPIGTFTAAVVPANRKVKLSGTVI